MSNSGITSTTDHPSPPSSARPGAGYASRRIDVNSNAAFRSLSPTISRARSDSEGQDQFNLHRRHMDDMDDLPATRSLGRYKKHRE
ncbi:hypothetical protein FKM82_010591 [Ascaphus truei]